MSLRTKNSTSGKPPLNKWEIRYEGMSQKMYFCNWDAFGVSPMVSIDKRFKFS